MIADGDRLEIEGGRISSEGDADRGGPDAARPRSSLSDLDAQRARIDRALHDFTENTMAHLREEGGLLSGAIDLPETRTRFRDRHVLIVVRGTDHVRDLRALRAYIEDVQPGPGRGRRGRRRDHPRGPASPTSSSATWTRRASAALRSGAELIVHAYPDGERSGRRAASPSSRSPHTVVPSAGTSQDVAMLLAYEKGAALIVSVGAHFNLVEFLERRRGGMSSTFLTRLRIGETLVDAKGVSHLYPPR